jgi:demethylmenaquinone methyltransferase/2-methoxy-6-polyprenyl-1,4-benzoquinol methylase
VSQTAPGPSRDGVGKMFDRIAHRYDLLNRVLSGGLDTRWRAKVRAALPARPGLRVLDVATGTGDLLIELAGDPRVDEVVGVDIAEEMLAVGRGKLARRGVENARMVTGDAQALEAYAGGFDVVTIAFGIRNVPDTDLGLAQMRAALKPGGVALILEFSEPEGPVFGPVYRGYRRHLLPRVGGMLSGDTSAYRYLDETIGTFPSGEAFLERMRRAGFDDVGVEPLTFGSVSLYRGRA